MEQFIMTFSPILFGLIQVLKGIIPDSKKKYIPLMSVILGLVGTITLAPINVGWVAKILTGLSLGLSAVGINEVKNMLTKD